MSKTLLQNANNIATNYLFSIPRPTINPFPERGEAVRQLDRSTAVSLITRPSLVEKSAGDIKYTKSLPSIMYCERKGR